MPDHDEPRIAVPPLAFAANLAKSVALPNGRDCHEAHDPLAALDLPVAMHAQALKLLNDIALARTAADCRRAADRAEGFGLGLETLRALYPSALKRLYLAFDRAVQVRLAELAR